jgi:hypothetical protein
MGGYIYRVEHSKLRWRYKLNHIWINEVGSAVKELRHGTAVVQFCGSFPEVDMNAFDQQVS